MHRFLLSVILNMQSMNDQLSTFLNREAFLDTPMLQTYLLKRMSASDFTGALVMPLLVIGSVFFGAELLMLISEVLIAVAIAVLVWYARGNGRVAGAVRVAG